MTLWRAGAEELSAARVAKTLWALGVLDLRLTVFGPDADTIWAAFCILLL